MLRKTVPLAEARECLPALMDEAAEGKDIRIARGDGATFRLVPVLDTELEPPPRRRFGVLAGQITMADDFDSPLDDFEPRESE